MHATTTGTVTTQPTGTPTPSPGSPEETANKKKKRSKNDKKRRGFLCCRRRKKMPKKTGKKGKAHKRKPPSKVIKPLPPVSNEQLGDVVLVKNENQQVKKVEQVPVPTPTQKCDTETKKEEKKKTEREDDGKSNELKEKWLKVAKRLIEEDAQIAQTDFEQVASYIPPHVTKDTFVANMDKNRFSDVICLEHSRVHLNDFSYIHASYVEVESEKSENGKKKRMILTQLPLPETAVDFWQMVIEQKVKSVLLMVTDEEYNELGGDFVFPQNQDFLHFPERSIRVGEFKRVEISKGWMMRVVSIFNGDYKSFLHIHHLNCWPHNGLPCGVDKVKLMWQVQSVLRKYTGPVVYMSLSGCGRAGTFALFQVAHASLHTDAPFDMVKCLETVRNGRIHAVQTIRQFSFVYTLLAEHILGNGFCKLAKPEVQIEDNCIQMILHQLTIE